MLGQSFNLSIYLFLWDLSIFSSLSSDSPFPHFLSRLQSRWSSAVIVIVMDASHLLDMSGVRHFRNVSAHGKLRRWLLVPPSSRVRGISRAWTGNPSLERRRLWISRKTDFTRKYAILWMEAMESSEIGLCSVASSRRWCTVKEISWTSKMLWTSRGQNSW